MKKTEEVKTEEIDLDSLISQGSKGSKGKITIISKSKGISLEDIYSRLTHIPFSGSPKTSRSFLGEKYSLKQTPGPKGYPTYQSLSNKEREEVNKAIKAEIKEGLSRGFSEVLGIVRLED